MNFTDKMYRLKSQMSSNSSKIGLLTLVLLAFLLQKKKKNIFYLVRSIACLVLIEPADNLDRHKISDVFEFRQDQTILFRITCP